MTKVQTQVFQLSIVFSKKKYTILYALLSEADSEGACGACALLKIHKAYVIQR